MTDRSRLSTWSGNHGKRLPSAAYRAAALPTHVVICSRARLALFEDPDLATTVFGPVRNDPNTIAACLMPDHLHWLLTARDQPPGVVVGRFKSLSTNRAWTRGYRGKLWQRSFFDHVVRRSEEVQKVAMYIAANPVRAGLVTSWEDYPYSVVFESRMSG